MIKCLDFLLRRRRSEENGFIDDERRQDKSRVYFGGAVGSTGNKSASSDHLKRSETGGFGDFGCFWSNSLVVIVFSGVESLTVRTWGS